MLKKIIKSIIDRIVHIIRRMRQTKDISVGYI